MDTPNFIAAQGANLPIDEVFKFNGWPRYEQYFYMEPWFLPYPSVENIGPFNATALSSAGVPSFGYYFWVERLYWRRFVWGPNRQLARDSEFWMNRNLYFP
jgi:hypothetical protein